MAQVLEKNISLEINVTRLTFSILFRAFDGIDVDILMDYNIRKGFTLSATRSGDDAASPVKCSVRLQLDDDAPMMLWADRNFDLDESITATAENDGALAESEGRKRRRRGRSYNIVVKLVRDLSLREICLKSFRERISVGNCEAMLEEASMSGVRDFFEQVAGFVKKNIKEKPEE